MSLLLMVGFGLGLLSPEVSAAGWPDVDSPLRTGASAPADAAVVIGNEDYVDVPDVPYAARDAEAFRGFLVYTRGVPPERVRMLEGASPRQMEEAVRQAAAEVGAGGVLWVYFAGHGAAHPVSKERVLLGRAATLDPNPVIFEEGAVSVEALKSAASSGEGDVIFVVDACYSGAGRSGEALGDGRFALPTSYAAASRVSEWTATLPDEVASPLHAVNHGAFTYFAVGALRGWADGELSGSPDGVVTLREAQAYVERALRSVGQRAQTPAVVGDSEVAAVQARGLEAPPDLRGLDISAGAAGAAPAAVGVKLEGVGALDTSQFTSLDQARQLREQAAAAEAQLTAAALARREVAVEDASVATLERAAADWKALLPVVSAGGDEARRAVLHYLEAYGEARVTGEDEAGAFSVSLEVPEVAYARAALDRIQEQSGGGPTGRMVSESGYAMVLIPAGRYRYKNASVSLDSDGRRRYGDSARLSTPYYLGETEVSAGLWESVMGEAPTCDKRKLTPTLEPDQPIACVDLRSAVEFANALSEREGLEPCYEITSVVLSDPRKPVIDWPAGTACGGYRLPLYEEWMLAATSGGVDLMLRADGEPEGLCQVANVGDSDAADTLHRRQQAYRCSDGFAGIAPVGSLRPNAWGFYDLLGNVQELAWLDGERLRWRDEISGEDASYSAAVYSLGTSWLTSAEGEYYYGTLETDRFLDVGLRLARSAPE